MNPTMSFQDWCIQQHAYLLLHFYQEGNNPLPPEQIGFSSAKPVQFRCHVCGMSWQRTPNHISTHPLIQTCPFCTHRKPSPFYNLTTEYPELSAEWDSEKNAFPPTICLARSQRNVFWRCAKNHRWRAVIRDRAKSADKARKSGTPVCPYCSGKRASPTYNLATQYPEIAAEWNYTLNHGLKPEDFLPYSQEKIWWRCTYNPSHQWAAKIANRTLLGRGCPHCPKEFKMSYPARALFYYLRQAYPGCTCEEPFQNYKIDIFVPELKLALEHDGYYYHSSPKAQARAEQKDRALNAAGYQVLRIRDRKDLPEPVILKPTEILYRFDECNQYLDQMIAAVFSRLGLPPLEFHHQQEQYAINRMYFHERKKRTLAVEYPELIQQWSSRNSNSPETVLSGSTRKVWWSCLTCGLEYQATIANRTRHHSNCPSCARTAARKGRGPVCRPRAPSKVPRSPG